MKNTKKEMVDVYKFSAHLVDNTIDEYIFTEYNATSEDELKEIYFTEDKIKELKERLIKRIQESRNPFNIYCSDTDCFDNTLHSAQHNIKLKLFNPKNSGIKSEEKEEK